MNSRVLPFLVAALLIVGGLVGTFLVRGAELNTIVGAGIGAALFAIVGTVVAIAV